MAKETKPSETYSRRSVLKQSSVGAASLGLVGVAPSVTRRERVAIARGGLDNEVRSTETVPRAWLRHEDALEPVQSRLSALLRRQKSFVNGVRVTAGDKSVGDTSYSKLEVQVDHDATAAQIASLPDSIGESPVSGSAAIKLTEIGVKRDPEQLVAGGCPSNQKYDSSFPGGYWIEQGSTVGTSGYEVYDQDKDRELMLTANHVVANDCSLGSGNTVTDHDGTTIGSGTNEGNYGTDWICLKSDSDNDWGQQIYSSGSKTSHDGYVTKNGAKVIDSKGYIVENFGSFTGYDSGTIAGRTESGSTGCVNLIDQAVVVNCQMGDGDSGGPIWFDNSDGTFVIGHNSLYKDNGSKSCQGLSGDYGPKSWTFPFFRIQSNNAHLEVLGSEYSG